MDAALLKTDMSSTASFPLSEGFGLDQTWCSKVLSWSVESGSDSGCSFLKRNSECESVVFSCKYTRDVHSDFRHLQIPTQNLAMSSHIRGLCTLKGLAPSTVESAIAKIQLSKRYKNGKRELSCSSINKHFSGGQTTVSAGIPPLVSTPLRTVRYF